MISVNERGDLHQPSTYISLSDMDLFPGPHSVTGISFKKPSKEDITTSTSSSTIMMTKTTVSSTAASADMQQIITQYVLIIYL